MTEATAVPAVDKTAIRSDLERTRETYRELIAAVPDDKWGTTSGNAAFTCGQLAWHIAGGLDFGAGLIEGARKGKQTNPPSFIMPIAYKLNEFRIKRSSRNATRESVLADYERGHTRLLGLLDQLNDADFAVVKTNFGTTSSVREMFDGPVEHMAEHAPEIRAII